MLYNIIYFRYPERNFAPGPGSLLDEELFADPGQGRIALADGFAFFKYLLHRERIIRPGRIVNSGQASFHQTHNPFCQITIINQLYLSPGASGREARPRTSPPRARRLTQ